MVVNSARDEACKDEAEAQMSARQRPQSARPFAPAAPAYAHQPAAPNRPAQRPQSAFSARSTGTGYSRPGTAQSQTQKGDFTGSKKPCWLENDRKVLRFYGFFLEDVEQSSYESQRVRRVVIYYYLQDSKMKIDEPKIQNSGIPQGKIVNRSVVKNPETGRTYEPDDLDIGGQLELIGRQFHIVDADEYTRSYYEEVLGRDLGQPDQYPGDRHTVLEDMKSMAPVERPESIVGAKKRDTLQQFMTHDRHVLSFSCFWDDTRKLYGEKRKFILNYYLADDTVEVREVLQPNSGRDPFPMLLRRQRLPKRGAGNDIVRDMDLQCGGCVHVYSRDMWLIDCDDFTRQYYRQRYGLNQEKAVHLLDEPKQERPEATMPPHNGFGSEEDSAQNFRALKPKAPRKNLKKANRMDRKVLRFRAKFISPPVQDKSRRFIVSFYLADDTVSIFEPPQRNSGVGGGKFLERGKFRHMEPPEGGAPRFFQGGDFFVGAVIPVEFAPHQQLQLLEADAFSLKYCEGNPNEFPLSDMEQICLNMVNELRRGEPIEIRHFFREGDPGLTGALDKETFIEKLKEMNLLDLLRRQELITLLRRYDEHGAGSILYNEFCDDLSRCYLTEVGVVNKGMHSSDDYTRLINMLRQEKTKIRKVFRRVDRDGDGNLSIEEWLDLLDFYQLDIKESEARILHSRFDEDESGTINYNEFCDQIYPCRFGLGAVADADEPNEVEVNPEDEFRLQFKNLKYDLRKNFRARDYSKTGELDEDQFIEAIAHTKPVLSDHEKFMFAHKFFPFAGSTVNYTKFMTSIFA
jgi:Ca2+-binding EF-hand superfamily protein